MNSLKKIFGIGVILLGFTQFSLASKPEAQGSAAGNCVSSFSNVEAGIYQLISEKVSEALERKRLYETYLAPGRLLGSVGFQAAMRHLYIRLNAGADVPLGAKAFGTDVGVMKKAGLVDGRMFYGVIQKDPKHASDLIVYTMGTLFHVKDLFPEGTDGVSKIDKELSARELERRAKEIGFSVSDYINASKEITPLLEDPTRNAELTEFLVQILPEYGPIVVKQALASEPPPPGRGVLGSVFKGVTGIASNMGANRGVSAYHQRWVQELKNGIDEIAKTYSMSPNHLEALVATHNELQIQKVPEKLKITVPEIDIVSADEGIVKGLSREIEMAARDFFRILVSKGPTIADPMGWTEWESKSRELLKKYPKANRLPRVTAVAELTGPLNIREQAIKKQLNELEKVLAHLDEIETAATATHSATLDMQEALLEHLTQEGQNAATPKFNSLMHQTEVLEKELQRLTATRTQLEGLKELLLSQALAIKRVSDGLLYAENITESHLSDGVFAELENLQMWATRALSDKSSGKQIQAVKLIGTSKASVGGN